LTSDNSTNSKTTKEFCDIPHLRKPVTDETLNKNKQIKKKGMRMKKIMIMTAAILAFGLASADTMTYEFGPDQETQNATITGTDVDISASLLTLAGTGGYDVSGDGWGITGSTPADSDSGANYLFIRGGAVTTSLNTNDYINFTVTADSGTFDVTGASLFARTGGTSQETNFELRSDVDGYTANLFSGSKTGDDTFKSFSTSSISGITGQTEVEFRLYVWGSNSSSDTHRYDDISLTVVPEPATLGMVATAGLAMLLLRRRMTK